MGNISGTLMFLLVFGLLVFFHEMGHFLAAKAFRMKVEEFAFGFFWPLLKWRIGETQYVIRAVPLGGYVRIAGMEIEDEVETRLTGGETEPPAGTDDIQPAHTTLPPDHPDRFHNRPPYQRFLVYLAGPVFSFIFGWLALCLVGVVTGMPDKTTMAVREIKAGSPAQEAGLKVGETIVALDGKPVDRMEYALDTINASAGKPIAFTLKGTDGQTRVLTITPRAETIEGERRGLIGITPRMVILSSKHQDLATSFATGTRNTQLWFQGMIGLFQNTQRLADSVGGPVAIFKETKQATELGGAAPMLLFGQLSLSLGFFNLIPIPILDGGHMSLILLEVIRRRKLTAIQTQRVLLTGLAVILVLFVTVLAKDFGLFNLLNKG